MLEGLQDFTTSLPAAVQWLGVMAAGAVPFIESYAGAVLGVAAGLNPVVAIAAAIAGNIASMVALVFGAHAVRGRTATEPRRVSPRRQRLRRTFDRYGIAGVSMLGQTILPSQITSSAMVSFGAPKEKVIFWQTISIIVWGVAFGVLAALGLQAVDG